METEIWKDVPEYEGRYKVSNLGRVKSVIRHGITRELILKQVLNKDGYHWCTLYKNGRRSIIYSNIIVATAFLGYVKGSRCIVVDHINGIKSDNRVENLRIVSLRYNVTFGYRKDKCNMTSKYAGVSWHKKSKKWYSRIYILDKSINLGFYDNEIDAASAYENALKRLRNSTQLRKRLTDTFIKQQNNGIH